MDIVFIGTVLSNGFHFTMTILGEMQDDLFVKLRSAHNGALLVAMS